MRHVELAKFTRFLSAFTAITFLFSVGAEAHEIYTRGFDLMESSKGGLNLGAGVIDWQGGKAAAKRAEEESFTAAQQALAKAPPGTYVLVHQEKYDAGMPSHPLSRVRRKLKSVIGSLALDAEVLDAPAFLVSASDRIA